MSDNSEKKEHKHEWTELEASVALKCECGAVHRPIQFTTALPDGRIRIESDDVEEESP